MNEFVNKMSEKTDKCLPQFLKKVNMFTTSQAGMQTPKIFSLMTDQENQEPEHS